MTVRKFYLGCFELHDYFEIKQYIETCLLFEPGILNIIKTLTHKWVRVFMIFLFLLLLLVLLLLLLLLFARGIS